MQLGGTIDELLVRNFAIALFIGMLVGIERERKGERHFGGLRTFALIAIAGAVCAWLDIQTGSGWLFATGGLMVAALVVSSYLASSRHTDGVPGATTEVAALLVYLLGGAALYGFPEMAVALAITTSALLAYKRSLHEMVGKLSEDDIVAMLKLLFATFIVLPLLPDEPVDPLGVLNPWQLWWLVILISALALVGYVATRWLGTGRGLALTALFGGLVSSTAITLSFARRSRDKGSLPNLLAMGILLAWAVMFVRVTIAVAVLNPRLLATLAVPMLTMGAVATAIVGLLMRAGRAEEQTVAAAADTTELRNPFSLTEAVKFGLAFAFVLVLVGLARQYLPDGYLYVVAGVAGMTDVDAISLSFASLSAGGELADVVAVTGIIVATLSNTWVKTGIVASLGGRAVALRVGAATVVLTVAGGLALAGQALL